MAPARPDLLAVRGVSVGQVSDRERPTGVTVVVFDDGAPTVVDVRGGASGTYDTASLNLEATFGRRWAIFFSGGSLYGLDAGGGVRTALVAAGRGTRGFGSDLLLAPVSGAVVFDLGPELVTLPDYAELGRHAVEGARRDRLEQGRVGAGTGATVAKYLGRAGGRAGGVGSAARGVAGGGTVGVLSVVNAAGAVRDPSTGRWVAVARGPDGREVAPDDVPPIPLAGRGTTVTIVATDLALTRAELARVAAITHAGVGRAVVPYLTSVDGDLVFASATGEEAARPVSERPGGAADLVGRLAAEAAVEAVLRAVAEPGTASD
ncbi:MAG TPA: P1 family peptidase [Thermoplasmata archaeon]|nr:P1 family peptidase [Thermoplasmata archaeon]